VSTKDKAEQAIYDHTRATRQDAQLVLELPEVRAYFKEQFQKKLRTKHHDGRVSVYTCEICDR